MGGIERSVPWLDEFFIEIEDAPEIFKVVAVGLAHETGIDECEDDFTEIVCGVDVPASEDRACEEAIAVDGVVAESEAEFLS